MATFKTADIERERPEEDFTVECASGTTYAIGHPKDVRGEELLEMTTDDPGAALRTLLGDETFYELLDEPEIDGWALEGIFDAWIKHFGLDVNRGNGRGSRRRSTGTGKRSKPTSRSSKSR